MRFSEWVSRKDEASADPYGSRGGRGRGDQLNAAVHGLVNHLNQDTWTNDGPEHDEDDEQDGPLSGFQSDLALAIMAMDEDVRNAMYAFPRDPAGQAAANGMGEEWQHGVRPGIEQFFTRFAALCQGSINAPIPDLVDGPGDTNWSDFQADPHARTMFGAQYDSFAEHLREACGVVTGATQHLPQQSGNQMHYQWQVGVLMGQAFSHFHSKFLALAGR